jgi:hypothetical protein
MLTGPRKAGRSLVRPTRLRTLEGTTREILPEQIGKLPPTSRDSATTRVTVPDTGKEEEKMYHYMQFDPSLIRERNEQIRTEVGKLRLEKRLRGDEAPASRFVTLSLRLKSALRSLRSTALAGR